MIGCLTLIASSANCQSEGMDTPLPLDGFPNSTFLSVSGRKAGDKITTGKLYQQSAAVPTLSLQ